MTPTLVPLAIIIIWLLASAGVAAWLLLQRQGSRVRNYRRPSRRRRSRLSAALMDPELESRLA